MVTQQLIIGIATVVGLLGLLALAIWQLGRLSSNDEKAREIFLMLLHPASIVSLLILLGVLFLLAMAILDLDKGRVLLGMGKPPFARGLITYLFSVVTIGTAVVLVLSALLGTEEKRVDKAKEVLGLLLGVFGTIVGFYFASELSASELRNKLTVSPVLLSANEAAPGSTVTVTVSVQGGTAPYRYSVSIGQELPDAYSELVRPDGWVVKPVTVTSDTLAGIHPIRVGIQDAAGEKLAVQSLLAVAASVPAK